MDTTTYHLVVEPGGYCEFNVQPTNSLHAHRNWEICVVTGGSGEYFEAGQVYPLEAGNLFSSPPDVLHEIRSMQTRDLELFFVSFSVRIARGGPSSSSDSVIGNFLSSRQKWVADARHLTSYGDLIAQASQPFLRDDLARLFCLQAMELLSQPVQSESKSISGSEVRRATRFIQANCRRRLSVEEVADHVHLTPKTLQRRFLAQTGSGVGQMIRRVRMEQATHQLLMGYSVQEVADSCGITDPSQFSAAFLREIGVRPKHFQQRYLNHGL